MPARRPAATVEGGRARDGRGGVAAPSIGEEGLRRRSGRRGRAIGRGGGVMPTNELAEHIVGRWNEHGAARVAVGDIDEAVHYGRGCGRGDTL